MAVQKPSSAVPSQIPAKKRISSVPHLLAAFNNLLIGGRYLPAWGLVSGYRQKGGNWTEDKQMDWGLIAEIGLSPDRNPRPVLKPGYSEVP